MFLKLSNKMKTQLKKRLSVAIAILAISVLFFACLKNNYSTNIEKRSASIEKQNHYAKNNTIDVIKDSTGIK